jgi:hypothetical protein
MSFHCDVCCTTLQTEKSYQKHLQTAPDIKQALNEKRQQHFEAFQSRFEDQDKEIMKQLKTDVELMLIMKIL